MGFLPNGINAYLMNLGWKNFENNTLELNQASKIFDLNHIGKSPSRFDFSKLKNINSQLLKKLSVNDLTTLVLKTVQNPSQNSKDRLHKAMPYLLERAETINDLIQSSMWLCTDDYKNIFKETPSLNETDLIRLSSFKDSFQNYKITSKNELENHFNTWLAKENIKIKEIGRHLRLCLTGTGSSIDLLSIFYLLGCSEIVKRIDYNINCLN
jgi:glutamyl-tRNA synthetase